MNHHHKGKNRRFVRYAAILAAAVLTGALSVMCAFAAIAPAGSDGDAGKIWIGENREQTYETLDKAVAAAGEGDVIHLQGNFREDGAAAKGAAVNKAVTLDIAENTVINGDGTANGITLSGGAKLRCSGGASLTMSGFKTALTVGAGSIVQDGKYVLDGNEIGFALSGTGKLQGSGRSALTVSAKNSSGRAFSYDSASRFIGCTVDVQANKELSEQYNALHLENASLTTKGVWYYFNPQGDDTVLSLDHSDFYAYKATGASAYKQTMSIHGPSEIKNGSVLTSDGSRITNTKAMKVTDSELVFRNSYAGGLNINYGGTALFTNSTLTGVNMRSTPLYGAGLNDPKGQFIKFTGDSVVNTPAKDKTADNGGADSPAEYIVTGGSFKIAYDAGYNYDVTTPTNGEENGNERLTLFTLTDTSVTSLNPINKTGETYTYSVAKASDDQKKHVWVPAAKVTFRLNNGNASFADGTTKNKTAQTIRGYRLDDVTGNTRPGDPSDSDGSRFLGWFYRDSSGAEKAFVWDDKITEDREVYAKWDMKTVVYHNGWGETFISPVSSDKEQATVLGYDVITKQSSEFSVPGKQFCYWTKDAAGKTQAILPGAEVSFAQGETSCDLYAQYDDLQYQVSFSANGGQFSDTSVFKQNPDVFEIQKDANGGETAVLRNKATYGQTLHELLGSFDYNKLKPDTGAVKTGSLLADQNNWNSGESGSGKSYRFDDYKLFGFFEMKGDNPEITGDTVYYLKWKDDPKIQTIETSGMDLPGDIWGRSQNTSSKTEVVCDGETFSLTGAVDISSVKEKMTYIENMFSEVQGDFASIGLTDPRSVFTAVLTMPEGVKIPDDPEVSAEGLGDCFVLGKTSVDGQKITVTFTLRGGLTDYQKLKDAVDSAGVESPLAPGKNTISVTVGGLGTDGGKTADEQKLTVTGTVNGNFSAVAKKNDEMKRFRFSWSATQSDTGRDENATEKDTIQHTLLISKPMELILGGDILIGEDTEHEALHQVNAGDTVTYTGRLDVSSIKEQIQSLKDNYGGDADKITTDRVRSTFTAILTMEDGLVLPENPTASLTDNDLFEIRSVEREGQRVTIVMGLKKEYTKFSDLYRDVTGVSDTLDMKVPGVKIPADTKDGTKLKVTGEVTGTFTGEATSEAGTLKAFNYRWKAEQAEEGRDFVIQDPDNKTIQYTISVVKKAADKPDTPDKPDKPNKPDKPDKPNKPDKPDKPTNLENKKDEEGMGPLTGDQTSVLLWGGTALLAVLAAAGLILKRRRRS